VALLKTAYLGFTVQTAFADRVMFVSLRKLPTIFKLMIQDTRVVSVCFDRTVSIWFQHFSDKMQCKDQS
jgi:hypothetical protein